MKKILELSISLIALSCFVTGCGGGGGGSAPAITDVVEPTPIANRQLHLNDQVIYTITGSAQSSITGTATMVVAEIDHPVPNIEGTLMQYTTSYDIEMDGKPYAWSTTNYIAQDAYGTILECGNDSIGTLTNDNASPVMYANRIKTGDTWTYNSSYSTNYTEATTRTVLSSEIIAGVQTYKVESVYKNSTGTEWFAPSLGFPAKMLVKYRYDADTYIEAVATMQSSNF